MSNESRWWPLCLHLAARVLARKIRVFNLQLASYYFSFIWTMHLGAHWVWTWDLGDSLSIWLSNFEILWWFMRLAWCFCCQVAPYALVSVYKADPSAYFVELCLMGNKYTKAAWSAVGGFCCCLVGLVLVFSDRLDFPNNQISWDTQISFFNFFFFNLRYLEIALAALELAPSSHCDFHPV